MKPLAPVTRTLLPCKSTCVLSISPAKVTFFYGAGWILPGGSPKIRGRACGFRHAPCQEIRKQCKMDLGCGPENLERVPIFPQCFPENPQWVPEFCHAGGKVVPCRWQNGRGAYKRPGSACGARRAPWREKRRASARRHRRTRKEAGRGVSVPQPASQDMCRLPEKGNGLQFYFTGLPGFTSRSAVTTLRPPSAFSAESIMPWLSMPRSLRGGRLAMKHTCLPTSCSGA